MRVLVVGGYGVFGIRAAERLAANPAIHVTVAGRDAGRAASTARDLAQRCGRDVGDATLDALTVTPDDLQNLGTDLVLNASGPFQDQTGYGLARAAIAARCHYVDLADARAFVTGITALDAEARAADLIVVSGASSVPAVSSAAVDTLCARLGGRATVIEHAISPGNSYDPGPATIGSILQGVGRPLPTRSAGRIVTRYGWQGLRAIDIPGLGKRLAADCDVPDLDLFAQRYPALDTLRFRAGLELVPFQLGLWLLAVAVRIGVINRPERLGPALTRAKRLFGAFGSDRGGMVVEVTINRADNSRARGRWSLVAGSGHGTYVPTLAAVALAGKLASGRLATRGALPCMGLVTLDDIEAAAEGLDIRTRLDLDV